MGLFYNYNKEGPGVSKNGPKKRVFFVFFETLFRNLWRLIPVSLMYWLLFLIPGFSAVGMTYITRSLSRDKHSFGISDFFFHDHSPKIISIPYCNASALIAPLPRKIA